MARLLHFVNLDMENRVVLSVAAIGARFCMQLGFQVVWCGSMPVGHLGCHAGGCCRAAADVAAADVYMQDMKRRCEM